MCNQSGKRFHLFSGILIGLLCVAEVPAVLLGLAMSGFQLLSGSNADAGLLFNPAKSIGTQPCATAVAIGIGASDCPNGNRTGPIREAVTPLVTRT